MPARRRLVVFGLLGTTLDAGAGPRRWERWRPTVALCGHDDLVVDRLELLVPRGAEALVKIVAADIAQISPETVVRTHPLAITDPWNLEQTYGALYDLVRGYDFASEREDYLAHITTGTHIAQISLFLLVEARHLPGRLLQTAPPDPEIAFQHAVASELLLEREQMKRRISQGNVVQMIDVNPEELSLAAVNKYLEIKARGTL